VHFSLPTSVIHPLIKSQSKKAHPEIQRFSKSLQAPLSEEDQLAMKELVEMRRLLASNDKQISFEDFGASQSSDPDPKPVVKSRSIKDIYNRASIPRTWSEFLFRLVRLLEPSKVLEIGTNLGVGAVYIQRALDMNKTGELYSLEGSESLSNFANGLIDSHCEGAAILRTGPFSRTLPALLHETTDFSLVFIDGHHTQEAASNYFNLLRPHLSESSVVIFI